MVLPILSFPVLAAQPQVLAWDRPAIQADAAAASLARAVRGGVSCELELRIDDRGELLYVVPTGCPSELATASVDGLWAWSFHPPVLDEVAVPAAWAVRVVYVAASVETPMVEDDDEILVRVLPTAVPQWPLPPAETRWMDRHRDQARCQLDLVVDDRGLPELVERIACDAELAERVLRYGRTWGFEIRGGQPGDGQVYRLDLRLE